MNQNENRIGKNIAELRKRDHLTQEQVAKLLNVSPQAVSKWENGISLPDTEMMPKSRLEAKIAPATMPHPRARGRLRMASARSPATESIRKLTKYEPSSDALCTMGSILICPRASRPQGTPHQPMV